jgi:hypothetical protein
MPTSGSGVKLLASAGPVFGLLLGCQWEPSPALGLSRKSSFREERFSDDGSASPADGTTCYPGRRHLGATAHYGVSVTVKGSENERAQPINRQ